MTLLCYYYYLAADVDFFGDVNVLLGYLGHIFHSINEMSYFLLLSAYMRINVRI